MSPKPDLVILAIPLAITPSLPKPAEAGIVDHSWILNYTLSFGLQEWDVIAVAPSVLTPKLSEDEQTREAFCRKMVAAQDLGLIVRPQGDTASAETIFTRWFKR